MINYTAEIRRKALHRIFNSAYLSWSYLQNIHNEHGQSTTKLMNGYYSMIFKSDVLKIKAH